MILGHHAYCTKVHVSASSEPAGYCLDNDAACTCGMEARATHDPAASRALAEEALALAQKATPGPWEAKRFDECQTVIRPADRATPHPLIAIVSMGRGRPNDEGNRDLIAHAGTHYADLARALLAALDREARAKALLGNLLMQTDHEDVCPAWRGMPCQCAWGPARAFNAGPPPASAEGGA